MARLVLDPFETGDFEVPVPPKSVLCIDRRHPGQRSGTWLTVEPEDHALPEEVLDAVASEVDHVGA